MGGRGTFASGKSAEYSYNTVDKIEGVKVLEGIKGSGKHSLPESSHSSDAYIKLNKDGSFREIRFYDKSHVLYLEIAYHPEHKLTGNRTENVLHYHTYDNRFSVNKTGPFSRSEPKLLTKEMITKYKKFFKGVKI